MSSCGPTAVIETLPLGACYSKPGASFSMTSMWISPKKFPLAKNLGPFCLIRGPSCKKHRTVSLIKGPFRNQSPISLGEICLAAGFVC